MEYSSCHTKYCLYFRFCIFRYVNPLNPPFSGFDNTYATTTDGRGSPLPRTGSPDRTRSRSTSPIRRTLSPSRAALDESASSAADLDPEAVRIALREYVTLMANTERERDDAIAQVRLWDCLRDSIIYPYRSKVLARIITP